MHIQICLMNNGKNGHFSPYIIGKTQSSSEASSCLQGIFWVTNHIAKSHTFFSLAWENRSLPWSLPGNSFPCFATKYWCPFEKTFVPQVSDLVLPILAELTLGRVLEIISSLPSYHVKRSTYVAKMYCEKQKWNQTSPRSPDSRNHQSSQWQLQKIAQGQWQWAPELPCQNSPLSAPFQPFSIERTVITGYRHSLSPRSLANDHSWGYLTLELYQRSHPAVTLFPKSSLWNCPAEEPPA